MLSHYYLKVYLLIQFSLYCFNNNYGENDLIYKCEKDALLYLQ